jgi:integrase
MLKVPLYACFIHLNQTIWYEVIPEFGTKSMRKPSYLKQSPVRETWSYRRDVPKKLVHLWGKTSEKVKLETKDYALAYRKAAAINLEFEAKAKRLGQQLEGKALPAEHLSEAARDILVREGIHPQQIPTTKKDALKFFQKQDEWKEQWLDVLPGYTEVEGKPNDRGGWDTEYEIDESNPWYEAYKVLNGRKGLSITPTITEATEMYLRVNARKKKRTPASQKKHEQRIWRVINALGCSEDLITDFNRLKAVRHKEVLESSNPNWKSDTLNKALGMLSAVFTFAIWQYELSMTNPWSGLKDEVLDREDKRRSFTPDELSLYVEELDKLNPEARLIGLLMVHTGCRTMECAGLTHAELRMQNNTPHLQLRPNHIRSLKNKQSKRDVPLIDKALDALRPYLAQTKSDDPKDPVFPRYGRDGGMDAVSQLLNGVIRKRLKIDDPTLVAYSTRHTMKDKMRTIRATAELQHSILGHGTRTDADNYGEGELLRYLLDELVKADALTEWGN